VLGAVAAAGKKFGGGMVFAGPPLAPELRAMAERLGLGDRVREVVRPDNATLEALYAGARALVFPSRWEGFGWPIIEAQACGCPVVCGNGSALPEVAGAGAILCEADDHAALGRALVAAGDPAQREALVAAGRRNAARYSTEAMVAGYVALYSELAGGKIS
jgi:glycosyltransferase involved in cell wall biosynthesis